MASPTEQWTKYHQSKQFRLSMEPALRESWERAILHKINPQKAKPVPVSPAQIRQSKQKNMELFIYSSSVFRAMKIEGWEEKNYAVLLFEPCGILIDIFAPLNIQNWLKTRGIEKWTDWSERCIGPSLFSSGCQTRNHTQPGEENFARFLLDSTGYTSQILRPDGSLGGIIALLVSRQYQSKLFQDFISALTQAIAHHYQHAKAEEMVCNATEGTGYVSLDISVETPRILIFNAELFNILRLPEDPYFFYKPLSEYIAPPPANKSFWNIIERKIIVSDKTIQLTNTADKTITACISTLKANLPALEWKAFAIVFHSLTRIQKLASRYIGSIPRYTFDMLIGESSAFTAVKHQASHAAKTNANILLLGESGTGKDLLAQAIHNASLRKNGPFVAINCAAFSRELIGSELFGYEGGAFTGARKEGSIGKFEMAHGGTLFLDEIGDMPLDLQAMLLRALEERCFMKVGGTRMIHVDVRIIAATNKNIEEKIPLGLFRADLFYRLGVVRIKVPPLRQRNIDILLMTRQFQENFCREQGRSPLLLTEGAKQALLNYPWPGNVRELQNLIQELVITHPATQIEPQDITRRLNWSASTPPVPDNSLPGNDEREKFLLCLQQNRFNKSKTAQALGMSRSTFYRRLKEYGLDESK